MKSTKKTIFPEKPFTKRDKHFYQLAVEHMVYAVHFYSREPLWESFKKSVYLKYKKDIEVSEEELEEIRNFKELKKAWEVKKSLLENEVEKWKIISWVIPFACALILLAYHYLIKV
jgi:hypothetical protein